MGGHGCTINGTIDDSSFSEPMPWIGIYIAIASTACSLAMAIDAFHGFRYRRFWFPCKFFSLNATTLTLMTVATKLAVDLNTSMPRRQDQLAKLSSSVMICTVIGNFMPSLGTMQTTELMMNLVALIIFVITVIVNICIQLGTGVIYVFWKEHAAVMFLMMLLLVITLSSALTIPFTKLYFDEEYKKKYKLAIKECHEKGEFSSGSFNRLSYELRRFWMMAYTCSPQFVMGRLATCTASGGVCLASTSILLEAMLRCYLIPRSLNFCEGESDYKWSSSLILVTQVIAIGIGSIAPVSRWLLVINFQCPKRARRVVKFKLNVEKYWTRKLKQWKECPLVLGIHRRHFQKVVHNIRDKVFKFCIWIQIGIVVVSKMVRLGSIFLMMWLLIIYINFKKMIRFLTSKNVAVSQETVETITSTQEMMNLGHYVLHLEGEAELIELMMESNSNAADYFLKMARKKQPKRLLRLLENLNPSREYEGVRTFDSEEIPSLNGEEPRNSWSLPVVTLTSIALSLPGIELCLVKDLIISVKEALMLIRVVEQNLDSKRELVYSRTTAEIVWSGIDLHHKWLDVDLHKMALGKESTKEIIEGLGCVAKSKFMEFVSEDVDDCIRAVKVLASNTMYRICQTLLLNLHSGESDGVIFEKLCSMITDIVGACLSNLPEVISMQCHGSRIEEREENVRNAIILLCTTEEILMILDRQTLPSLEADKLRYIDEWRRISKTSKDQVMDSPTKISGLASGNSSELHVTIE